jgi:hypothetical protein
MNLLTQETDPADWARSVFGEKVFIATVWRIAPQAAPSIAEGGE